MLSGPLATLDTSGTCMVSELMSITIFLNLLSLVADEVNCLGVKPSAFISSSTLSLKRGSIGKSSFVVKTWLFSVLTFG